MTAATGDGDAGAASSVSESPTEPTSGAQVAVTAATDTGSSSNGLAIAGLVAGVLGLIVGGIALVRARRP